MLGIGIVLVLGILAVAGLYYWGSQIAKEEAAAFDEASLAQPEGEMSADMETTAEVDPLAEEEVVFELEESPAQ